MRVLEAEQVLDEDDLDARAPGVPSADGDEVVDGGGLDAGIGDARARTLEGQAVVVRALHGCHVVRHDLVRAWKRGKTE